MIVFLDSSALIYYFEGAAPFKQAVVQTLKGIKAKAPDAKVAVSRLGVMECRVKPLREANTALLRSYDEFFAQVQIVELSAQVVNIATQLRVSTALKTPDCLQAACALSLTDETRFLTGDAAFMRVAELKVELVNLREATAATQ